jgi:hypothetical protein
MTSFRLRGAILCAFAATLLWHALALKARRPRPPQAMTPRGSSPNTSGRS